MQKMQKCLQTARTLCILFIVQNCLLFLVGVTTLLGQSKICGDVPGSEPISAIFCVRMLNKAVLITAMALLYVIGGAVALIVLTIPDKEGSKIQQAVPQTSTLKAFAWVLATTFSSLLLFLDGGMQNTIIQRKQLLISYIWLSAMASYLSLIAVQIYVYIYTIRKHPDEALEDCEVVV
ncbi:uncharacterized protein LOC128205455 isoform X2 [Mya arenaria]|nr:uncharacterized protein LOC128205455 isoform X2 [Mya arenaria]